MRARDRHRLTEIERKQFRKTQRRINPLSRPEIRAADIPVKAALAVGKKVLLMMMRAFAPSAVEALVQAPEGRLRCPL